MIRIIRLSIVLIVVSFIFSACINKAETPHEMLVGKWIITSQEILGITAPGDGSWLQFNDCSTSCNGTDYMAGDQSTGSFTYVMDDDATTITISDSMNEGGYYNYTFDILELTKTNFRITTSTILGNLKIEMTKSI